MDTQTAVVEPIRAESGGKFLTFFLAGEEYGLEILRVREIIGMQPITRVPRTPAAVRGVINLRGKVIPIVDLRVKFGMEVADDSERTCIIVVQAQGVEFGVVVDRVSEVADVAGEDVEEAPSFGTDVDTEFLLGIAKTENAVKLLLDIERVLSAEEIRGLHAAGQAASRAGDGE